MDIVQKMFSNLDYDATYTITFVESDGEMGCYDLWLDKADTAYCLQTIIMVDGVAEEVGDTTRHNKFDIMKKLTDFSLNEQFSIRECD